MLDETWVPEANNVPDVVSPAETEGFTKRITLSSAETKTRWGVVVTVYTFAENPGRSVMA